MWPAVVSHRDLTVTDGERSAARYADVLGLRRLRRTGFDDHLDAVEYAGYVCPPRSPWPTSAVTGPLSGRERTSASRRNRASHYGIPTVTIDR